MSRKKKFVNKTQYPDYAIERYTCCIFDDVLAFLQQKKDRESMRLGKNKPKWLN